MNIQIIYFKEVEGCRSTPYSDKSSRYLPANIYYSIDRVIGDIENVMAIQVGDKRLRFDGILRSIGINSTKVKRDYRLACAVGDAGTELIKLLLDFSKYCHEAVEKFIKKNGMIHHLIDE